MNDKISDKDKQAWKDFLSSNEKLPDKDNKLNTSPNVKIKHIDLHGFTLQEANKTIEKFINDSYDHNVSKIIVVTGKGLHSSVEKAPYVSKDLSILKYSVPDYIENNPGTVNDTLISYVGSYYSDTVESTNSTISTGVSTENY